MKRTIRLLFFCQALMNSTVVGQAAMSALIGYSLASDKSLATLPMAVQMVSTMLAVLPAGVLFARLGRKPVLVMGAFAGVCANLIFAAGVWQQSFLLYCLGAIPAGIGFGVAQQYRFAAAEVANPSYRPRAIALVMAGGVLAAAFGPEIVKHTKDSVGATLFLGTYLVIATLPLLCMALLTFTELPPPPPRRTSHTPIGTIVTRPGFFAAASAGMAAYGTMNLVMAVTPVEMMLCGFGVNDSSSIIQAHAIGMFLPGFLTGRLIVRYGVHRVILTGAALSAICAVIATTGGRGYAVFWVALVLLGVGWNFMFVGATTLLSVCHAPEDRVRTQAINDFLVFATIATTSLSSGMLHARGGWEVLNLSILPPLAIASLLVALHWRKARQTLDA